MSDMRFSGLSTGIDTTSIVKQLMVIESRRLAQLQVNQQNVNQRTSALEELQSKVRSLQTAATNLSNRDRLTIFEASSSNRDAVTATASSTASPGTRSIQVKQLATSETWILDQTSFNYPSDFVGGGNFIYTYNGREVVINTTEERTTLQDMVNLINNDRNNPGVTASLLQQQGKVHLMLTGQDMGSDFAISVNNSNSEMWNSGQFTRNNSSANLSTKLSELDQFDGLLAGGEKVTINGRTGDGTEVTAELAINRNTTMEQLIDKINETFGDSARAYIHEGRIHVRDSSNGESQMQISLGYDGGEGPTSFDIPAMSQVTVGGSVNAPIASLNPDQFIRTQSAQDSLIKVDGYPREDQWIATSSNTVSDALLGVTLNLQNVTEYDETSGTYGSVNITVSRNTNAVASSVESLIKAFNETVSYVDQATSYDSETKKMGILSREMSVSFLQTQIRNPFVSRAQGFHLDNDSFIMAADLGITTDGRGQLKLDKEKLTDALTEDLNGVLNLLGIDQAGNSTSEMVRYSDNSTLTAPGTYNVRMANDDSGENVKVWIKKANETWDQARLASPDEFGLITFGSGDERGMQLQIEWDGQEYVYDNATPNQGNPHEATIHIKQGFAGQLESILKNVLRPNTGSIDVNKNALDTRHRNFDKRIEQEKKRLERVEERLVIRYARLERTLSLMQQQFGALNMIQ